MICIALILISMLLKTVEIKKLYVDKIFLKTYFFFLSNLDFFYVLTFKLFIWLIYQAYVKTYNLLIV